MKFWTQSLGTPCPPHPSHCLGDKGSPLLLPVLPALGSVQGLGHLCATSSMWRGRGTFRPPCRGGGRGSEEGRGRPGPDRQSGSVLARGPWPLSPLQPSPTAALSPMGQRTADLTPDNLLLLRSQAQGFAPVQTPHMLTLLHPHPLARPNPPPASSFSSPWPRLPWGSVLPTSISLMPFPRAPPNPMLGQPWGSLRTSEPNWTQPWPLSCSAPLSLRDLQGAQSQPGCHSLPACSPSNLLASSPAPDT